MTAVWAVLVPCALIIVVSLVGLVTVVPYLDGRDGTHRDKWIRASSLAWACYKLGKRHATRRRYKLADRYEARKGEA